METTGELGERFRRPAEVFLGWERVGESDHVAGDGPNKNRWSPYLRLLQRESQAVAGSDQSLSERGELVKGGTRANSPITRGGLQDHIRTGSN